MCTSEIIMTKYYHLDSFFAKPYFFPLRKVSFVFCLFKKYSILFSQEYIIIFYFLKTKEQNVSFSEIYDILFIKKMYRVFKSSIGA